MVSFSGMANKTVKTQQNYIYGIVVRTPFDSGVLNKVILPELDGETYVIAAPDIPGKNRVEVYGVDMPIFADSNISYCGQAVLAMFSDDKTDLEIKARHVEILRDEVADVDLSSGIFHTERYHFQETKPEIPQDAVTVETSFRTDRVTKKGIDVISIRVYEEDDLIIVDAPTKWPALLRRTVADVLGIPVKNVRHRPNVNRSSLDDTLFDPIIVSGIAAVAMKKTGRPVRMDFECDGLSSRYQIDRKTVLTSDGIPIQETVSIKVDQGAFPTFSKEICNQLAAGTIPPYRPQQMDIEVSSVFSHSYPTAFYGSMGFNVAMHSSNRHMARVARRFGMNLVDWWKMVLTGADGIQKIVTIHDDKPTIAAMLDRIVADSDFRHRDSVYRMQSTIPLLERQDSGYSRGIGIACGHSLNGFSNELKTNYKISMTLESNDRIILNIGLPQDKDSSNLWKKIAAEEMGFDIRNVSLVPPDDDSINDSGPDCLARDTGIIPKYIKLGCDMIKQRRFNDPLPITVDVPLSADSEESNALFNTHSWCMVVAEVELDMVLFRPVVRHIWASSDFGNISDERTLTERFNHVINGVISSYGFKCNTDKDGKSRFGINLINRKDGYTSSATPVLRSLTIAAMFAAIEQAMGKDIDNLPVTGEDIFRLISVPESEVKEAKEEDNAAGTDN